MSMIETPPVPVKTPKPRGRRKKKLPPAIQKTNDLAGIEVKKCPDACSAGNCVISGVPFCGHPWFGGKVHITNAAAEARYQAAIRALGKKTKLKVVDGGA